MAATVANLPTTTTPTPDRTVNGVSHTPLSSSNTETRQAAAKSAAAVSAGPHEA